MVERIEEVEGVYPPGVDGKQVDVTTINQRYVQYIDSLKELPPPPNLSPHNLGQVDRAPPSSSGRSSPANKVQIIEMFCILPKSSSLILCISV